MLPMPAVIGTKYLFVSIFPIGGIGKYAFLFEVRHPLLSIINGDMTKTAVIILGQNGDVTFHGFISISWYFLESHLW